MAHTVYNEPVPVNTAWSQHIVVLCSVMPFISGSFVFLRFYARRMKGLRIGLDDWLILPAYCLHTIQCGVGIWGAVGAGAGHHKQDLSPQVMRNNGKLLIFTQIPWTIGLALTKTSACLLLRRVFNVNRVFNACVWVLLFICVGWGIANFLKVFLDCQPLAYNWDKTINGHCDDVAGAFLAIAIIDVITDLCILLLPMPFLWRLQMPVPVKIGITFTFGMGYFTVAMACLRISSDLDLDLHGDINYTEAPLYFFSYLEFGVTIWVACMVVLRPLLDRYIMPLFPTTNTYRAHHGRGGSSYANLDSDSMPLKNLANVHTRSTASNTYGSNRKSQGPHKNDQINVQREVTVEEESI